MLDSAKIEAYIENHAEWKEHLSAMRSILLAAGLDESVKWGGPCYSLDSSILISIVGFKKHCAVWFHQGALLKDTKTVLVNAQEGRTKAMRQLRFEADDKLNKELLAAYVKETIANHRAGIKIKPAQKTLSIPVELNAELKNNKKLAATFDSLTPGKQREYADHIASAKQEKTRLARMEKSLPQIFEGRGLYDKYKNC